MEKFMDHYGNVAAERKLRTPGSKRRPAGRFVVVWWRAWRWWRRERWICIAFACYSGVEAGGGVRARAWQAAAGQQQAAAEAGGGVRAADGNLPLPSRRFVIPEVGRSWRY
ncbi:hypothetical protein PF005_g16200 [Phytophthora fragariae]|uniref:Uncharacterized protein n=1 Tax=Phytophthora fragariae TaxID=53985 RepID=A0A6A3WBQ6_9STRA|nr:hypothetical protein PF002_g27437 [Phytophthora fragariae]KAE9198274.1 hypothetical protein PF005_g16200 [Phytophthora fragariae]